MRTLLLCIIILAACSKKQDKPSTSIKVLDGATNSPVRGAAVHINKGDIASPSPFGNLFIGVTDDNGICKVQDGIYSDADWIFVGAAKYWSFQSLKQTTAHLTPEGWLQLHFHRINSYPIGSTILVIVVSESGRYDTSGGSTEFYSDILYTVRGFGNQQNKIDWEVHNSNNDVIANGTLNTLLIPRFDTLKGVTLNY